MSVHFWPYSFCSSFLKAVRFWKTHKSIFCFYALKQWKNDFIHWSQNENLHDWPCMFGHAMKILIVLVRYDKCLDCFENWVNDDNDVCELRIASKPWRKTTITDSSSGFVFNGCCSVLIKNSVSITVQCMGHRNVTNEALWGQISRTRALILN